MTSAKFILIRQGEGVIEGAEEDIFDEKYVKTLYDTPGIYKVFERKDCGDYNTSKRLRVFEFKAYAAEDKKDKKGKKEPLDTFDASSKKAEVKITEVVVPPLAPKSALPPAEFSIVRKAGSPTLRIIDDKGNIVHDNFTLEQLKAAKEAYAGETGVRKKDLKDQQFIQYVVVFLGGLAIGALVTYFTMEQKHSKEISALHAQLNAIQSQVKEMNAPRRVTPQQYFVGEFNKASGGPEF